MNGTSVVGVIFALALAAGQAHAQQTLNCSDEQIGLIYTTQVYGGLMLLGVGNYLGELRRGGDPARFEYWYGPYSSESLDFVEDVLTRVYNVIPEVTYNCDCDTGADVRYAYVRTGDPRFHLRVCPLFFSATNFVDENIATFVHELSHFFGTRDCMDPNLLLPCSADAPVPEGAEGAHEYAQRDPATAIFNAYNLERFVTDSGRPR